MPHNPHSIRPQPLATGTSTLVATPAALLSNSATSQDLSLSRETPCARSLDCQNADADPTSSAEMIVDQKQLPPAEPSSPNLSSQPTVSFCAEYFKKPICPSSSDVEVENAQFVRRRFSLRSPGSVATASIMLLCLLAIVTGAAAFTLKHKQHKASTPSKDRSPIQLGIPSNFPDPSIWYENDLWHAIATNNAAGVNNPPGQEWRAANYTQDFGKANVQMAYSPDFVNWTLVSLVEQPLPFTGEWTGGHENGENRLSFPNLSSTWAPAMIKTDAGTYVMYYTSALGGRNPYPSGSGWHPQPHCIGVATADTPWGPFQAQNTSLACPVDQGGAIDPSAIRDIDGTLYLVYKIDGNNIGSGGQCGNMVPPIRPTPIVLQKMSSDGITPIGTPVQIETNIAEDGPLIEAPMLVRSPEGFYFLFFSSGCTRFASYTTKYATATSVAGPYERHNATLLQTGDFGLQAPGSVGIAQDGSGKFRMAFHGRRQYAEVGGVRAMFTTTLEFQGREVKIAAG